MIYSMLGKLFIKMFFDVYLFALNDFYFCSLSTFTRRKKILAGRLVLLYLVFTTDEHTSIQIRTSFFSFV